MEFMWQGLHLFLIDLVSVYINEGEKMIFFLFAVINQWNWPLTLIVKYPSLCYLPHSRIFNWKRNVFSYIYKHGKQICDILCYAKGKEKMGVKKNQDVRNWKGSRRGSAPDWLRPDRATTKVGPFFPIPGSVLSEIAYLRRIRGTLLLF